MKLFRTLFIAAAAVASLSSCSNNVCKIEGKVGNLEGQDDVKVCIVESRNAIDTVDVINGTFKHSMTLDETKMYSAFVSCNGKFYSRAYHVQFFPDAKNITIVLDTLSSVSGSPLTDAYNAIMDGANAAYENGGYEAYLEFSKKSYVENCQNVLGEELFQSIVYELSLAEFDEYLEMGSENLKNNDNYKKIRKSLIAAEASAVGSKYLDFSGVSPEGKDVKLSDYVGKHKITLVDFWASWCGPCMRSMPAMVKLWNTYHKKGLDIVGVAVWDGDNSASRVKITEKGMVWPQIFVGNDKTPTDIYGINGIPHVILIDADGTILYRDVPDEEEIEAIVKEKIR